MLSPGPVVLEHGPHDVRIVGRPPELVVVLAAHNGWIAGIPAVRVSVDDAFRDSRLGEEEPVPVGRREPGIGSPQVLTDRDAVQHRQANDPIRCVEGQPERDGATAVVARRTEAVVAELSHDGRHVAGNGSLAMGGVVGRRLRAAGLAVAAQIGAYHREACRHEQRRHPVPR